MNGLPFVATSTSVVVDIKIKRWSISRWRKGYYVCYKRKESDKKFKRGRKKKECERERERKKSDSEK